MSTDWMALVQRALAVLLLGVFVLIAGSRAAYRELDTWPEAKLADDAPERLLQDIAHLQKVGLAAGRGTANDAASELNPLVGADGSPGWAGTAWWSKEGGFADLRALQAPGEWLDHPEITAQWDVGFLTTWRGWDHWDWDGAEPFATYIQDHPEECMPEWVIPNLLPLQDLAKVRLAQGYGAGDLQEALADARHLATLAASTDDLVGIQVALAIRRHEQLAYERGVAEGRTPADPARGWATGDLEVAKRVVLAFAGVFETAPESGLARILVERSELPGVCAGMEQGLAFRELHRDAVRAPWPGELDDGAQVRGYDELLRRSTCRLVRARAAWAAPGRSKQCMAAFLEMADLPAWLGGLFAAPYVRQPAMRKLIQLSTPNFLGDYEAPYDPPGDVEG